jgi:predicted DNA-binding protein (MmcQ/YjbR family)
MPSIQRPEIHILIRIFEPQQQTMNIEELRTWCISKKGVSEDFPFDVSTLVFKVMGKMFALTDLEGDLSINLKCDPEKAVELRELYPCVLPGYHMNKRHWNTILVDGSVPDQLIRQWIDHSYALVVEKLSKKQRDELATL